MLEYSYYCSILFYFMNYVWYELWRIMLLTILAEQMNFTCGVYYRLIGSWLGLLNKNLLDILKYILRWLCLSWRQQSLGWTLRVFL